MVLEDILAAKRQAVARNKRRRPLQTIEAALPGLPPARDFPEALAGTDCAVIAEVKRRSPSHGLLQRDYDPAGTAAIYARHGAAAISVLTDAPFFGGRASHIPRVRAHIGLPVLRKDFLVDPYQLYETRILGADAVLLIARVLGRNLPAFLRLASGLGLHALVEVRDREELDAALQAGAAVIGINNRDLATLETNIKTSLRLAPFVPSDRIVVAESGIGTRRDIELLQEAGIHAFLIGEALLRAGDPGRQLKAFLGT